MKKEECSALSLDEIVELMDVFWKIDFYYF
jgi:hypothetical protein